MGLRGIGMDHDCACDEVMESPFSPVEQQHDYFAPVPRQNSGKIPGTHYQFFTMRVLVDVPLFVSPGHGPLAVQSSRQIAHYRQADLYEFLVAMSSEFSAHRCP
jgi:hypothetical protein